jgi:hypothetical protein
VLLALCTGIGAGVARGAPSFSDLMQDGNIIFSGPGMDGARDIRTSDNDGGLRFYNGTSLDVFPQGAAIQFFGNDRAFFNGQAFIDSGAHDNAAVIFRTAPTASSITEHMRVTSRGNVGIGTTIPDEKLTLLGNQRILGENNPVARGFTTSNLDSPQSVYVSGHYAYVVSTSNHTLTIIDISDPDNPVAKGAITTNLSSPRSVFVSGRYAYVASTGNNRLAIFDVSDPVNPAAKGFGTTNLDQPISVYVSGRYAFLASFNNNALVVFDITDVDNPAFKAAVLTNLAVPASVFVAGHYAYLASSGNNSLVVYDVSNPIVPAPRGTIATNLDTPGSVYVSGSHAYVGSFGNDRLAIFDIADPDALVAKGFISTNLDGPTSVTVAGSYAYLTSRLNDRITVFDVSDPNTPVAKGFTATNLDNPQFVHVSGRYAYVASTLNDRLAVFDLNHLETPTEAVGALQAGTLDVTDNAIVNNDLYVQGGLNVGPMGAHIDGDVSIGGPSNATDKLYVLGDVRVGTSGTNGCIKRFDAATLIGTCVSDLAYKQDITPLDSILDRLAKIEPSTYLWKADEYPEMNFGRERTYGLIAQQVEQYLPELVATDEHGVKAVHYHLLPLFLAQGVRELKAENDAATAENAALREQVQSLEARLAALEQAVNGQQAAVSRQR